MSEAPEPILPTLAALAIIIALVAFLLFAIGGALSFLHRALS